MERLCRSFCRLSGTRNFVFLERCRITEMRITARDSVQGHLFELLSCKVPVQRVA